MGKAVAPPTPVRYNPAMSMTIEVEAPPLAADAAGVIRVAGTRVSLDTLLAFYSQGYTAEALHEAFDLVPLADVHAVIAYYLRHRAVVDQYLAANRREAERVRAAWEGRQPPELRERLLARRPAIPGSGG